MDGVDSSSSSLFFSSFLISSLLWNCTKTQVQSNSSPPRNVTRNLTIWFLGPLLVKACPIACNAKVLSICIDCNMYHVPNFKDSYKIFRSSTFMQLWDSVTCLLNQSVLYSCMVYFYVDDLFMYANNVSLSLKYGGFMNSTLGCIWSLNAWWGLLMFCCYSVFCAFYLVPSVAGTRALNKTHFSTSSHATKGGDSIAFVTVFAIYNTSLDTSNLVTVGNASYSKTERSMTVLNVFINFIQVMMPQSNVIILTDPASPLSVHRNRVNVYPIQGEYSRDNLMLQRIRSYITFLEMKLEELSQEQGRMNHYIFTDTDIAVVDDLGQIFHDYPNFHMALTFRNNKGQPLNSGFIAVRGTRDGLLRAKIFLQEVLKVYSSKFMNASRMLGDQLAIAWVIKSQPSFDARRFAKAQAFLEDIGGTSVLFLPCATYNWTPPEGAGQFHGMPLDVKVVHFKGSRKRLMLESWNFFSSSSDMSDMLCLILGSGRTKYDF